MSKILHTADFHLDSAFAAYDCIKARELRAQSRQLFAEMLAYAQQQRVEIVLIAGDLFESNHIYQETAEVLVSACKSFDGQIVIAPGNHDFYCEESPYARIEWPGNVHIFRSRDLTSFAFPEYQCEVFGKAFLGTEESESFTGILPVSDQTKILLLHGDLDVVQSRYRTILTKDIEKSNADYVALGHVHRKTSVNKIGDVWWAYPGCPEGHGFDETGSKGFYIGTLTSKNVHLEFVPFANHRYEILSVDISEGDALDCILKKLPMNTENDNYRIVLTGEIQMTPDTEKLTAELQNLFMTLTIIDETSLYHDLWEGINENTLRGCFLKEMKKRYDSAAEDEKKKMTQAVRYGLAALDQRDF